MTLSRREFLRVLGVSAAASAVAAVPVASEQATPLAPVDIVRARALHTAPLRDLPSPEAPVIGHLWEDEIFDIQSVVGRWLRSSEGYVASSDAQPMIAGGGSIELDVTRPLWAEVTAASASVRAWSSDSAPLVTKIGHGGVMRLTDHLRPQAGGPAWVGVADESDRLVGWSRAELWSAVEWRELRDFDLTIVRENGRSALLCDGTSLLQFDAAVGPALVPGTYAITRIVPGQTEQAPDQTHYGVPYVQESGNELRLGGVYWHNRIGALDQGMHVQLPVVLARAWFGRLRRVTIV